MKRALASGALLKAVLALIVFVMPTLKKLEAAEPDIWHRKAESLCHAGNYKEASKKADAILKYFPNDVYALIIKGKSEFYQEHYLKAGECFAKAYKKAPNHPVVRQYVKLLREIDYKMGTGASIGTDRLLKSSPIAQAEFFKRGYFGSGGTSLSGKALSRSKTAPTALKTPYPSQESILSETPVAYLANKALNEGNYNKAYLLFGQLIAVNRSNKAYLLGRAEAAFHMKRYRQVIKLLSPALADKNFDKLLPEQKEKAEYLLSNARGKLYEY